MSWQWHTTSNGRALLLYEPSSLREPLSAHSYICVLALLCMCPHTTRLAERLWTYSRTSSCTARHTLTNTPCSWTRNRRHSLYLLHKYIRTNTDVEQDAAGTQFTCCTSTKVQTLTPEELRDRGSRSRILTSRGLRQRRVGVEGLGRKWGMWTSKT